MKKIGIFYHVYQIGDWLQIYIDQITRLRNSGLYDAADYIFVNVNGNQDLPFELPKIRINWNSTNDQSTEFYAIKALYDYSYIQESNVLFLHAKGVTRSHSEFFDNPIYVSGKEYKLGEIYKNIINWKNYMEYFLIDNWKRCIELLQTYDCVGTEWKDSSEFENFSVNIPHYAGGMWWANSSYIKTLDANFITNNMMLGRFATELWIGMNKPNYYNFWDSNRNLYLDILTESEYKNEIYDKL